MPFIDLNKQTGEVLKDEYDFLIVGAGAAGILLSLKLAETKKKVLVIESGHFTEDKERQVLNHVQQNGKLVERVVSGRKRAIGGSTIAWGGQTLPFIELDFRKRPWIENSSWPIAYEEILPYYVQASAFMQIDELDYEDDILKLFNLPKPGFDDSLLHYHFSKWAPEPNFTKLYWKRMEKAATFAYNAVLKSVHLDEYGNADHISICNFTGHEYSVKSKCLVIACGGIETNRILLNCDTQEKSGIGNHSDWLGRCFMEHPFVEIGMVESVDNYRFQSCFNSRIKGGRKYSVRLSLSEKIQEEAELVNASAFLEFGYDDDGNDPYLAVKKYLKNEGVFPVINGIKNFNAIWKSTWAMYFNNLLYKHGAIPTIKLMLEQEPIRNSAISLGNEQDQFGMRKANIKWKISHKSWDTAVYMSELIKREMSRLSLAELKIYDWITKNEQNWETYLHDSNHHMGGTRMSKDRQSGVVNSNLQVWDHENIFVCSSSVYPTSSHSNPTLTLLALASRLSEFLSKKYDHQVLLAANDKES